MADIWNKKKRSEVMALIRAKNTKPEKWVRKVVSGLGYRYRLNVRKLPGTPDIVLRKYKLAIFVQGCFWHYHNKCRDGRIPSSNQAYWEPKLQANRKRDKEQRKALLRLGWRILEVWECEIKKKPEDVMKRLTKFFLECHD